MRYGKNKCASIFVVLLANHVFVFLIANRTIRTCISKGVVRIDFESFFDVLSFRHAYTCVRIDFVFSPSVSFVTKHDNCLPRHGFPHFLRAFYGLVVSRHDVSISAWSSVCVALVLDPLLHLPFFTGRSH